MCRLVPVFIEVFRALASRQRMFREMQLAEGEELESNILQVGQRGPANLSVRRRNRDWTPGDSIIVQRGCREMNVAAP